jgi:Kef-type K+ transport system membrane component KefB
VAAASLTSSGEITARVLSDLDRLQQPESRVILGATVIDDVFGLVILAVVPGLTQGKLVTVQGVATTTGVAFSFLAATLIVGSVIAPPLVHWVSRVDLPGRADETS